MSREERLEAFILRSVLYGPLIGACIFFIPTSIILLFTMERRIDYGVSGVFLGYLVTGILSSYLIGIIPAWLFSWYVGKRIIFHKQRNYVLLILMPPFILILLSFIIGLIFSNYIALIIALYLTLPMIFSSFICRFLFRKYLLDPDHD